VVPNDTVDDRYTVRSVAKAMRLLEHVAAASPDGLNLTEASARVGVSKSAGYSLVRTLLDGGYLRATEPGPRYSLGVGMLRLGDRANSQLPMSVAAAPILRDLNQTTGLTVRLSVVDDGFPVFVERIDGQGSVRFHAPLGVREHPHATAAGKAILATLSNEAAHDVTRSVGLPSRTKRTITDLAALDEDLERIRRQGYAIDDEEDADGVRCVASAYFDHTGACAGAVSATGLTADIPYERVEELGTAVSAAARRLTNQLSGR
jgi:IclR family acetate operon transcriptional repressor